MNYSDYLKENYGFICGGMGGFVTYSKTDIQCVGAKVLALKCYGGSKYDWLEAEVINIPEATPWQALVQFENGLSEMYFFSSQIPS